MYGVSLLSTMEAMLAQPPRGPLAPWVEGMLHLARAAHMLDSPALARRALQRAAEGLPRVPGTARQAVYRARWAQQTADAAAAQAMLARAQALAATLDDPTAAADTWAAVVEAAAAQAWPPPLRAAQRRLPALADDPWAQVRLWHALLRAWVRLGAAYPAADDLLAAVQTWEAPFVAHALRLADATLRHPAAQPALDALEARIQSLEPGYARALAEAAAARLAVAQGRRAAGQALARAAYHQARRLREPPFRAEALAQAAHAAAVAGAVALARTALQSAAPEAAALGYMDDRARALHPVVAAYETLGAAQDLAALWPAIASVGYPRFFAPLAAHWLRAAYALGATEAAQQAVAFVLAWAEREPAAWQQVVLLRALPRFGPALRARRRATAVAYRVPEARYRAQALAQVATLWRVAAAEAPWRELWAAARALRASGPRTLALTAVARAWAQADAPAAWQAVQAAWDDLAYPNARGAVLVALASLARLAL